MNKFMILLLLATFLLACNEDKAITGYTVSVKSEPNKEKATSIQITSGFAIVNEVELDKDGEQFQEIDIEGSYRFDLVTGVSTPAFPTAEVPAGNYDELEVEMGKEDGDTAIYIEALYSDDTSSVNVYIAIDEELEFELEDEVNGVNIDPNTISQLNITLNLSAILSNEDWSQASRSSGAIYVSRNNNTVIYYNIVSAINTEIDLDEDDD